MTEDWNAYELASKRAPAREYSICSVHPLAVATLPDNGAAVKDAPVVQLLLLSWQVCCSDIVVTTARAYYA